MEVVLLQDHPDLGQKGIVVKVKPGYFRNYLSTRGMARLATAQDRERFAKMEEERQAKRHAMLEQAAEMVVKLQDEVVKITAKVSPSGSLYAQIHELDIAKELNQSFGTALDAHDIHFAKAVKSVGTFVMEVRLSPQHTVQMQLVVEADES